MRQEGCAADTDEEEEFLYSGRGRDSTVAHLAQSLPPAQDSVRKAGDPSGSPADLLGEYDCPICLDLLVEPVVGCCGHDFCKHCLELWVEQRAGSAVCPICRKPLPTEIPGICKRISRQVEAHFPEEFKRRKAEVAVEKEDREKRRATQSPDALNLLRDHMQSFAQRARSEHLGLGTLRMQEGELSQIMRLLGGNMRDDSHRWLGLPTPVSGRETASYMEALRQEPQWPPSDLLGAQDYNPFEPANTAGLSTPPLESSGMLLRPLAAYLPHPQTPTAYSGTGVSLPLELNPIPPYFSDLYEAGSRIAQEMMRPAAVAEAVAPLARRYPQRRQIMRSSPQAQFANDLPESGGGAGGGTSSNRAWLGAGREDFLRRLRLQRSLLRPDPDRDDAFYARQGFGGAAGANDRQVWGRRETEPEAGRMPSLPPPGQMHFTMGACEPRAPRRLRRNAIFRRDTGVRRRSLSRS